MLMQRPPVSQYEASGSYDSPVQSPQIPQTIVTRLTQVDVPFVISEANQQKLEFVELLYSMDRGKNWDSYQKIAATEKKFEFNAPEDAEYWFTIRAKFKTGEIRQLGATPSACAIVDTHPPQLTLNARRNPSGEVIIEWTVEDVVLKRNGHPVISLSYDANISWMTLAVDPKNVKREGNRETGHVTFWPRHDALAVEIRCDSEDAAGNKEIQTTRLELKQPDNETPLHGPGVPNDVSNNVTPVPDMMVMPPRPYIAQRAVQPTDGIAAESEAPLQNDGSDNTLMDLVRTMGGSPPSAVTADVTQRYANNVDGNGNAANPSTLPDMLSTVPASRFVPAGETVENATAGAADSPAAIVAKQEVQFPGKIKLVSLGHFGEQQCIIVRWHPGDAAFVDSKVDLYRSETLHGPWRPVAFDLKNSSEYYWLVSAADKMPFYLRVDLRSKEGLFTDFTVQTISLPLSFSGPAQGETP